MSSVHSSIACSIAFVGSLISTILASETQEPALLTFLSFLGTVMFGLLLVRLIVGSIHYAAVVGFLLPPPSKRSGS
ncbi:MAG: hypothetical protein R3C49_00675 [Planctomycetaceae bacterium]